MDETAPRSRASRAIPLLAALVPPLLATLSDPEARGDADGLRDVVLGLGLAADRSLAPPLGQLLAPLATLVPIGPLELRASILLALPAACAAWLVARRVAGPDAAPRARGAWAIALAFALTAGVLLGASGPAAALVVVALELSLAGATERPVPLALGAASACAAWCAPRLLPAIAVALVLGARSPKLLRRAAFGALPVVAFPLALSMARGEAWLSLGQTWVAPTFLASPTLLPAGALLRASLVCLALGLAARGVLRAPDRAERASPIVAATALACAFLLRAPDAFAVGAVVLAPMAATFAGGLAIAVERHLTRPSRLALAALVPALALGLAARAFEVELGARRIGEAAVAHDAAPLFTLGVAPPRAVLLLEDEAALLRFAHARLVFGLRPDVHVLPAQRLAAGGAARMASATIAAQPTAVEPLRALLARGALEASDVSPLALKASLLTELPFARLRGVARYVEPTGGPLVVHLERIDPSDRKLRRAALERRLGALARWLSARPEGDRARASLRVAATREARALALAYDRDGALAAVARAESFGADPARSSRWRGRLAARQGLDAEPVCADD